MPKRDRSGSLSPLVTDFLAEQAHANRSRHTCRAYATDLAQFAAFYQGPVGGITAEVIRGFGATLQRLRPASRARKQAALASFLDWAHRQGHVASDPMALVERVHRDPPRPRSLGRKPVEAILAIIPTAQRRDRLLFRLIFETGLRRWGCTWRTWTSRPMTSISTYWAKAGSGARCYWMMRAWSVNSGRT